MPRGPADLVIEQLAEDLAEAEALLVTYRSMAQMAVAQIAGLTQENKRLREARREELQGIRG
jgi:hypothetical protein